MGNANAHDSAWLKDERVLNLHEGAWAIAHIFDEVFVFVGAVSDSEVAVADGRSILE